MGQVELNLAVVMKAAQAVSQEILLDRVVEVLMTDMIVHTGAQYGLLLLMRDGEPFIEASGRVIQSDIEVELASAVPTAEAIPIPILNTVVRTKKAPGACRCRGRSLAKPGRLAERAADPLRRLSASGQERHHAVAAQASGWRCTANDIASIVEGDQAALCGLSCWACAITSTRMVSRAW